VPWCAPKLGSTVYAKVVGDDEKIYWRPAEVRSYRHLSGAVVSFAACINKYEQHIERFMSRQEGKKWRREMPRKLEAIEVEVEDEGQTEWRRALVQKRNVPLGEFTAVVCFPDGTPDEEFLETFRLSSEGCEWRRIG